MLAALAPPPGTDVLVLTPYTSRRIEEAADSLRTHERRVYVHVLEGIAPESVSQGGDTDEPDAFVS